MVYEISQPFRESETLRQFIEGLPDTFGSSGTLLWNGRNKIRSFRLDLGVDADTLYHGLGTMSPGETTPQVVVKRFKHLSVIQKIVYAVRPQKGRSD